MSLKSVQTLELNMKILIFIANVNRSLYITSENSIWIFRNMHIVIFFFSIFKPLSTEMCAICHIQDPQFWTYRSLTEPMVRAAADDARFLPYIYHNMMEKMNQRSLRYLAVLGVLYCAPTYSRFFFFWKANLYKLVFLVLCVLDCNINCITLIFEGL